MVGQAETGQRIARLTPLADVLARIDAAVAPVVPRNMNANEALGRVLAADVVAPVGRPAVAIALIDGLAVESTLTLDASSYAPALLSAAPPVAVGGTLPAGADAVASHDSFQGSGGDVEILTAVASGAGVLPADGDMAAGTVLRRAGERLRASDLAVFAASSISSVSVRMPRVCVVPSRPGYAILDAVLAMIAHLVAQAGGEAEVVAAGLEAALKSDGFDAVIAVGGTGAGPQDDSVHMLARVGRVDVHGVGISPGETVAFGTMDNRPVLLIPGRLDAGLAVFATLGTHVMERLTGALLVEHRETVTLSRKITSTIGLAEFIPLRRDREGVTPLGVGYLPMQALTRADGWLLVPPDSEGYPAGTNVRMRAWP